LSLASVFSVSEQEVLDFPFTPIDPLIVSRENPVDPRGEGGTSRATKGAQPE
jgi:hypothetical protein